jgi:hypothetical protein
LALLGKHHALFRAVTVRHQMGTSFERCGCIAIGMETAFAMPDKRFAYPGVPTAAAALVEILAYEQYSVSSATLPS